MSDITLADRESLVARIVHAERKVVFLVGAALSQPEGDDPGVPGVDGVIEEIREIIRLYQELDERFESALANSGDGRSRYQRAMEFLSHNLGPQRVQSVIVRSVQKARNKGTEEKEPSRNLENDLDYWHLNSGTAALGEIISKHRDRFAHFQLTVNFDPLLHVAIRRAAGQPTFSVLNVDGTLPDEEGEVPDSVRIVHLHGFWRGDTMHTPQQLRTERLKLRRTLENMLRTHLVVAVGYSGWNDVFTRTLAEVVQDVDVDIDVLWSCYSSDEREIQQEFSTLFSQLQPAMMRGRFTVFQGIDCHWLFPELLKRLDSRGPAHPLDPERAPATAGGAIAPEPVPPAETGDPYRGGPTRAHFDRALRIIAQHGDTDIFPFPAENAIFTDRREQILALLCRIHGDFDEALSMHRMSAEGDFAAAGYFSFRRGTQIDPLWNAYLLGLVISIGSAIEAQRIPVNQKTVFSYRFQSDDAFDDLFLRADPFPDREDSADRPTRGLGWASFHRHSIEVAETEGVTHVAMCDIADFYHRIQHTELQEALFRLNVPDETSDRILKILGRVSSATYGLPVGGDASRLLSELLLNKYDKILQFNGVRFARFVDDYHLFAQSEKEAFGHLVFFGETLLVRGGMNLQRSKTRITSLKEFVATSAFRLESEETPQSQRQQLLSIKVHFDAYSPRAKEEFRELKERLQSVPIVSMLTQELAKIRIDRPLTERLVRTTKALDPGDRERVVDLLLDNLDTLYPIFTTVTMQLRAILDELPEAYKTKTIQTIRALLKDSSYVTRIPVHTVFAMRILAHDMTPETSGVLTSIFHASKSPMIRRDAILIMAARGVSEWIEDLTGTFDRLHEWERRALIIASHCLRGGQLWRAKIREPLGPFDQELIDWIDSRPKKWEIPI